MNRNKIYSFPLRLWLWGGRTYLLYKGDSHRQMGIRNKSKGVFKNNKSREKKINGIIEKNLIIKRNKN